MERRQLLVALLAAIAVYFAYMTIYNWLMPPPPPLATRPAGPMPAAATEPVPASTGTATMATAAATRESLSFSAGALAEPVVLGGQPGDALRVTLTPRGAAVASVHLTRTRKGRYVHAETPSHKEPYTLVRPVPTASGEINSLATARIWVPELFGAEARRLDDFDWELSASDAASATFVTTLRDSDGAALLRLTKSYQLLSGGPLMRTALDVENLTNRTLEVSVEELGPFGVAREQARSEMRRLLVAGRDADGALHITGNTQRTNLKNLDETKVGSSDDEKRFVWTALVNKYFGVFVRPLPSSGDAVKYVLSVTASRGAADIADNAPGGVLGRIRTKPEKVAGGGRLEYAFEVYAGAKDPDELRAANPAFADRAQIGYVTARDVDSQSCCPCQFAFLTDVMGGLLEFIYTGVRNYGIAIIILVIIVRTLLHPLSVFQQKAMYKSSEAMARIQPKLQALKEKYANDRARLNQESMKLYAEEGVNPAASMVGMVPLFIQMPILIALWTALSNDVHLRHAPFDGWWIKDLSAPDALVAFDPPGLTIPVLGWLVPFMFANISSLNLLPVLMGVSMWLQQRYMPKPHMQAKLDAARKPNPAPSGGLSPEDQLRQQQMIANMMIIMFPLMFYYMPSGLNLYWMATNVFGIIESLIVRKQIRQERERREREGPKPAAQKTSFVTRMLQSMARQAEELQKKADELSEHDKRTGRARGKGQETERDNDKGKR